MDTAPARALEPSGRVASREHAASIPGCARAGENCRAAAAWRLDVRWQAAIDVQLLTPCVSVPAGQATHDDGLFTMNVFGGHAIAAATEGGPHPTQASLQPPRRRAMAS